MWSEHVNQEADIAGESTVALPTSHESSHDCTIFFIKYDFKRKTQNKCMSTRCLFRRIIVVTQTFSKNMPLQLSSRTLLPGFHTGPIHVLSQSLYRYFVSKSLGGQVVKHLKTSPSIALPSGDTRPFWEVVEFQKDGSVIETYKTPDTLNLHPRDVIMFTGDSTMGRRALISSRSDGSILFRTETCKSIIYADRAILFPSDRGLRDTIHTAQSIKTAVDTHSSLPFELKVLESLLSETTQDFDKKYKRIWMVADTVMDDLNQNFHQAAAELSRFVPISAKLSELQNDVQETLDEIAPIVEQDATLKSFCVSDRAATLGTSQKSNERLHMHTRQAGMILQSYEFRLLNIQSALKELSENLDQNRMVWHMQLDHQRNNVLKFNVMLSIGSLCGLIGTVPAAFFGMNLHSGLESSEGLLWSVASVSLGSGTIAAMSLFAFFSVGLNRGNTYASRLSDLRCLRDLLYHHIDDLDQIIEMFKTSPGLSLEQFSKLARECFKGKSISQGEINLLYRVLVKNYSAALEMTNLVRAEEGPPPDISHHLT